MRRTRITDLGLKEIAGLKALESLARDGALITDAGIAELQKTFPRLRVLK